MDNINQFFKDNLDNKMAYVRADGLFVEGTIEEKCKLEFQEHFGLICSVKLQYNTGKVAEHIQGLLIQNREALNISYDKRDLIIQTIIPALIESYVQVAKIAPYGVVNISAVYNKEREIESADIKYSNGATVSITCIESIKLPNVKKG